MHAFIRATHSFNRYGNREVVVIDDHGVDHVVDTYFDDERGAFVKSGDLAGTIEGIRSKVRDRMTAWVRSWR